ncbi:MAG: hypothetical protein LBQ13_01800, partial [Endomicrobium sp.]|nr:hypothetical protein [Endomicrobium sp.]
ATAVIKSKSSPYLYGKDFKAINNKNGRYTQKFDYVSKNLKLQNIKIGLLGKHQVINASTALSAAWFLNKKGYHVSKMNIRIGLKNAVWHGRFDIKKIKYKNKKIELIIDGAHNVEGVNVFFDTFKQLGFAKKKKIFIFAVMKEKKYKYIVKKIAPFAKKVILLQINNNRAVSSEILKLEFSKYIAQNKISSADSTEDAFNMINSGETVIAVGSLYLAGKILRYIPNNAVLRCGKNGASAKKTKTKL